MSDQPKKSNFFEKLATFIVDKRNLIFFLYAIAIIASLITQSWVKVCDDLTQYLPETTETRRGLTLMEDEMKTYGTARIIVSHVTYEIARDLADQIEDLNNISSVDFWDADKSADDTTLPSAANKTYEDYMQGADALITVTFRGENDDQSAKDGLAAVKELLAPYDTYISTDVGYSKSETLNEEMGIILVVAALVIVLVAGIIAMVLARGIPHISVEFLTTTASVLKGTDGILPAILNTFYVILLTLLIVLPLGVGAAVYLTEYASNRKLIEVIEFTNETLAGIPSIIYGLVGMLVFAQTMGFKTCLLSGSLTLVVMNLPTIIRTTQESLKTVPQGYREGALGLGAGKWHIIRTIVLPCSIDGIVTGCILAVGRILGETAALLYTAGFAHTLYNSLRATLEGSGATLSVALYVYAKEQGEFDVAFAIAAILMALALLINLAAMLTGRYFKKRRSL